QYQRARHDRIPSQPRLRMSRSQRSGQSEYENSADLRNSQRSTLMKTLAVSMQSSKTLPMNPTAVGTSRCDVPARETAGGIVAPLNAARTAQRAVPTRFCAMTNRLTGFRTIATCWSVFWYFAVMTFVLLSGGFSRAGEEPRSIDPSAWEHSIVLLDVTRKQYDYLQPWTKRMKSAQKIG